MATTTVIRYHMDVIDMTHVCNTIYSYRKFIDSKKRYSRWISTYNAQHKTKTI